MPGYDNMAPKMESNKQERSNLLHDNPVAKDASGGRPWISKHFQSSMSPLKEGQQGSPAMAAKPDFPDIDGDNNTKESMKQAAEDKAAKEKRSAVGEKKYDAVAQKHCMGKKH